MKKYILLALLAFFFLGCTSPIQIIDNTGGGKELKLVVTPITIVEEKETIVTGDKNIITNITNATNVTNQTVPSYVLEPNRNLFVFFINVSYIPDWSDRAENERQGEAILIKKGDADILIDAGPAQTAEYLVNFLRQKGVDDIELFVSTHARPENYGGIETLMDNIQVEQFMWNGDTGNDSAYAAIVEKAKSRSFKTILATYLMNISINGMDFLAINPRNGSDRFFTIDNDGIVFKVTDRDFCLMTTGDISYGAQAKISDNGDFSSQCDILQIPNYGLGQGTARIDLFLVKVAPKTAIITGSYFDVANERYTIEEKLRVKGIQYYENFNASKKTTSPIRIVSDGYNYTVSYS